MKKFVLTSAMAFACFANPAGAVDDIKHTVNLHAYVAPHCSLGDPQSSGTGFQTGATSAQSTFEIPIDSLGHPQATDGTLTFGDFACNAKVHVYVSRSPSLKNAQVTDSEDFATEIPYNVKFHYGMNSVVNVNSISDTDNLYLLPSSSNPVSLQIIVNTPPNGTPALASGNYTDTLVLGFTPQV